MAQPPHYPQPGQGIPIPAQPNLNLQQMLSQKPPVHGPTGVMMQASNMPVANYQNIPQSPAEKTIIDEFEAAYQSCIAPLVPGNDNCGSTMVSTDKLRFSIEHSIQQFTDAARTVESYFIRKHAIVAQQPELMLQEEIEELKQEIARRDNTISNHAHKVKIWQEGLRNIQASVSERSGPSTPGVPNPPQAAGQMHPDMVQMQQQRR